MKKLKCLGLAMKITFSQSFTFTIHCLLSWWISCWRVWPRRRDMGQCENILLEVRTYGPYAVRSFCPEVSIWPDQAQSIIILSYQLCYTWCDKNLENFTRNDLNCSCYYCKLCLELYGIFEFQTSSGQPVRHNMSFCIMFFFRTALAAEWSCFLMCNNLSTSIMQVVSNKYSNWIWEFS